MFYFAFLKEASNDTEDYTYILKMQLCPVLLLIYLIG